MFSSPKYGGNLNGIGWKMIGFDDEHVFTPPFGHYDAQYTGFVPYTGEVGVSGRTFKPNETVDFVVVGSGASGGVIARELSQAGLTVLVFEQGPRMDAGGLRA